MFKISQTDSSCSSLYGDYRYLSLRSDSIGLLLVEVSSAIVSASCSRVCSTPSCILCVSHCDMSDKPSPRLLQARIKSQAIKINLHGLPAS